MAVYVNEGGVLSFLIAGISKRPFFLDEGIQHAFVYKGYVSSLSLNLMLAPTASRWSTPSGQQAPGGSRKSSAVSALSRLTAKVGRTTKNWENKQQ